MLSIGLDLSMRSNGVVVLDVSKDDELVDFKIVTHKDAIEEELLCYNTSEVLNFLSKYNEESLIKTVNIEYLALNAMCLRKDVLFANYWFIRYHTKKFLDDKDIEYTNPTVAQWRQYVIFPERAKEIKEAGENAKGWQKIETVKCLPDDVRESFLKYVKETKGVKKDAIYDLADAYFIAKYHNYVDKIDKI